MIDLGPLDQEPRASVEAELSTRVRAEDGSFGSSTVRELLQSPLAVGKCTTVRDGQTLHGVLLAWSGYEEPQVLPVSESLWQVVGVPVLDAPRGVEGG